MRKVHRVMFWLAVSSLLPGCGGAGAEMSLGEPVTRAIVSLHSVGGSGVSGVVHFTQAVGGVKVEAHVDGLAPGDHGFHIHQYGDCSAPDGSSAGGHFNPAAAAHGGAEDAIHHMGDLGNLTAGENGHGMMMDQFFQGISLTGANGIIGRAVIIQFGADDLTSQPAGAGGRRLACGVIGIAKPR